MTFGFCSIYCIFIVKQLNIFFLGPFLIYRFSGDTELDNKSASISIVGVDRSFEIIEGPAIQKYLDAIEVEGDKDVETDVVLENPEV